MTEEQKAECYVVVAEWAHQPPIVLETEGDTSLAAAMERGSKMAKTHNFVRWCVCKLTCAHGNPLVLMDLARFQHLPEKQSNDDGVPW